MLRSMEINRTPRLTRILNQIVIAILSAYFFVIIFFLSFYVHEFGHVIFGVGDSLLLGKGLPEVSFTNWISHPLIPFWKLPQQTMISNGSLNFIWGGIMLSLIFWLWLSLVLYRNSKQKMSFLIFFVILIGEIFGNYVCGTDNLTRNPLSACSSLHLNVFIEYEALIFAFIMLIIFLRSNLFKKISKFLDDLPLKLIKHKQITKQIVNLKEIAINDPNREKKLNYISGVNRIGDLINDTNRDIENKLVVIISIIFSALLGAFLTAKMYLQSILIFLILLIIWLITLIKENADKRKLQLQMRYLVKDAKEKVGLDLRQ